MSNVVTADVMLVPAEAAAQTADGPQLKKWGFRLRDGAGEVARGHLGLRRRGGNNQTSARAPDRDRRYRGPSL